MLTADQTISTKKLLPLVQVFLKNECNQFFDDDHLLNLLHILFEEGYCSGMLKMELFSLGNTEGVRVQCRNLHKYFLIKVN